MDGEYCCISPASNVSNENRRRFAAPPPGSAPRCEGTPLRSMKSGTTGPTRTIWETPSNVFAEFATGNLGREKPIKLPRLFGCVCLVKKEPSQARRTRDEPGAPNFDPSFPALEVEH